MSTAQELHKNRQKNGITETVNDFVIKDPSASLQDYYDNILTGANIEQSVLEYRKNMDRVSEEFKKKTGLHAQDVNFLILATLLQCARIYLVNSVTKIEKAGKGKLEKTLHNEQDRILGKFDNGISNPAGLYYAPLNQIITGRGVPYDAQAFLAEKMPLFKGANHRFSTLGHDPVFGLIFGTANILTNTITCINKPVIITNHVIYDMDMKNPKIGQSASTFEMFRCVSDRISNDKSSVVAALMKQIIHIATDMYTPCGIQLPGANLVLSKKSVEHLTKFVSTGDVLKIGASATLSSFINMIIGTVHGCLMMTKENDDLSERVYSVRTRKIILYSNMIASSSSILAASLTKNIRNLDIGGFAILAYRLFTDEHFIRDLKYEFLNSEVSKIYENKMKEYEMYYE